MKEFLRAAEEETKTGKSRAGWSVGEREGGSILEAGAQGQAEVVLCVVLYTVQGQDCLTFS